MQCSIKSELAGGKSEMSQCLSQYMCNMHKSQDEIFVLNTPRGFLFFFFKLHGHAFISTSTILKNSILSLFTPGGA